MYVLVCYYTIVKSILVQSYVDDTVLKVVVQSVCKRSRMQVLTVINEALSSNGFLVRNRP
jgi:hypothetical protein